jgi:hypothetical protein
VPVRLSDTEGIWLAEEQTCDVHDIPGHPGTWSYTKIIDGCKTTVWKREGQATLVFDPDFANQGIVPPGQRYDNGLIISDDEDSSSIPPLVALSDVSSRPAGSAGAPIPVPSRSPTPASAEARALVADSLATTSSSEEAMLQEVSSQVVCVRHEEVKTMVKDIVEKATAA